MKSLWQITAPTTRPAVGLSLATLDQVARELPPALETRRAAHERPIPQDDDGMKIVSGFEGSAPLKVKRLSETHFAIDFEDKFCNWFIFKVEGAKNKTIRVDVQNVALGKWSSLNPVYSYAASLDDPDAFTSKPSRGATTQPVAAHNGPLLPDTSGQQWHYIKGVWPDQTTKTLSLVQSFEADHAFVAMKVPYTPKLAEQKVAAIRGIPLAEVIDVGTSQAGRPLRIIKIGASKADKKPCILLYAREHSSEQDSSRIADGAISFLLSKSQDAERLRRDFTFLVIPMLDPDGAAIGTYESITYTFADRAKTKESVAYATWFGRWLDGGGRLDLVLNIHNVESKEAPHLSCALVEPAQGRQQASEALHDVIVRQASHEPYRVAVRPWWSIGSMYCERRPCRQARRLSLGTECR